MKRILIAGCESQTLNYRRAFAMLETDADSIPEKVSLEERGTPPFSGSERAWNTASFACLYDGLVLPGGGDISPALFHSENHGSRNIDESLDRLQLSLLQAFLSAGKPVLGICKGLQIINTAFGGTLIQDLNPASLAVHAWADRDRVHITKAAAGTFPFYLYGSRPIVNSAHHQAVETVGSELRVAQYAEDFVVEALYHKSLPVLGVQWHPERMCFSHARRDAEDGSRLLKYFLSLL